MQLEYENSYNFIIIIKIILLFVFISNLLLTKNMIESILLATSIYIFLINYPFNTIHAVDSNKYVDKIFTENGNKYKWEINIIS